MGFSDAFCCDGGLCCCWGDLEEEGACEYGVWVAVWEEALGAPNKDVDGMNKA